MFRLSHYNFYHPHQPLRIIAISDIHFSDQVKNSKLQSIAKFLQRQQPTHILISGDLIDYGDLIDTKSEQNRLLSWLRSLGDIAPTLIGLGNHDFYRLGFNKKKDWLINFNQPFFDQINQLPNVYVLDNTSYEDRHLLVTGLTLPPTYYNSVKHKRSNSIFTPETENKSVLQSTIESLPNHLHSNLPKHKLKLILIHSPVHLKDPKINQALSAYDYFISGHVHNGLVPPLIEEIWTSDRGFIDPSRNLFPKNLRNTIKTAQDKLIISGAITTFQKCSGRAQFLDIFYPIYINLLEFSNDQKHQRKPRISHKYLDK